LEERKRILRMKPKPRDVDVLKAKKTKVSMLSVAPPSETAEEPGRE
jgi:hypothetical protein